MSQYFPKPYENQNQNHLTSPKTQVDKLDIDKLVPVPVDLSKLSDVVKNDVIKNAKVNKLVAKVNNIDTSGFVLKTLQINQN